MFSICVMMMVVNLVIEYGYSYGGFEGYDVKEMCNGIDGEVRM